MTASWPSGELSGSIGGVETSVGWTASSTVLRSTVVSLVAAIGGDRGRKLVGSSFRGITSRRAIMSIAVNAMQKMNGPFHPEEEYSAPPIAVDYG
jgi:hypothetical protein